MLPSTMALAFAKGSSPCPSSSSSMSVSSPVPNPVPYATNPIQMNGHGHGIVSSSDPNETHFYEFKILQSILGRFIGTGGRNMQQLQSHSGAVIRTKTYYDAQKQSIVKTCILTGTQAEIEKALKFVRNKFPHSEYPEFTLAPINMQGLDAAGLQNASEPVQLLSPSPFPLFSYMVDPTSASPSPSLIAGPSSKLGLIEGVINDVRLSAYRNPVDISLQQPTNPGCLNFDNFQNTMSRFYNYYIHYAPYLLKPFNPGVICVARIRNDSWVRVQVICLFGEDSCMILHLDTGKVGEIKNSELRQIHCGFLHLPFQAINCKLYGIQTVIMSRKAGKEKFERYMRPLFSQALQATVVGYDRFGIPLVQLCRMDENQVPILINQELVNRGFAEYTHPEPPEAAEGSDEVE